MQSFLSHKYFKLFLLIITVLWLIIKSPFVFMLSIKDLGLDKSNPAVIDYHYLEFISWVLLAVPIFIYIFSKLDIKSFTNKYKFLILVFSNFFYAIFRIFKTFDVTDTGFHFTKGWGFLHGSFDININFIWGTSLVSGLWLSIINTPSILWARIGWVIVVCLIVLYSYKIIKIYFNDLKSFLFVLILSFFFINYNYYLSINYDNLSFLFSLIGSYYLLKYENDNEEKLWQIILSGVFLGLTIWLKFNYILIFSLPSIYYLVKYSFSNKSKIYFLKKSLKLYLGYFIAILMGLIFLFSTDSLVTYLNFLNTDFINRSADKNSKEKEIYEKVLNFGKSSKIDNLNINNEDSLKLGQKDSLYLFLSDSLANDSIRKLPLYKSTADGHTSINLFNNYFINFWQVLTRGFLYFIIFLFSIYLLSLLKSKIVQYSILSLLAFSFYYYSKIHLEFSPENALTVTILPGYIMAILFKRDKRYIPLVTLIFLMSLFSFPGSDLAFNVIYRSGAGLLLFLFPVIYLWNCKFNFKSIRLKFNYYSKFILIFSVLATLFSWGYVNVHRDLNNRSLLITMFKSKQLFGIHSTPQRVQVVDELLTFFKNEKYERNNTPSVCVGWIPMFYSLTETNCIFTNPWIECESFKKFKNKLDSTKIKPKYIIISTKFTRNDNWPMLDEEYKKRDKAWIAALRHIDYSRYYAKEYDYKKVFENNMFEVWKKIRFFKKNHDNKSLN